MKRVKIFNFTMKRICYKLEYVGCGVKCNINEHVANIPNELCVVESYKQVVKCMFVVYRILQVSQ
jgi:hypothetical protein